MPRYEIEIIVQVEAKSIEYIRDIYLPKEYLKLPDCVSLEITELEDKDNG